MELNVTLPARHRVKVFPVPFSKVETGGLLNIETLKDDKGNRYKVKEIHIETISNYSLIYRLLLISTGMSIFKEELTSAYPNDDTFVFFIVEEI
jgi:hypothetical protein